jgi:hypothetical protein
MGYMKIPNTYKDPTILQFKKVYALEKVHGTSQHVGYRNGKLIFYHGGETRQLMLDFFNHDALMYFFASKFTSENEVLIFGEGYGGKQQGMKDTYGPKYHFTAFDVKVDGVWLDVPSAEVFCKEAGVEFVPYEFIDTTEENINHERDRDSTIAIWRGMGEGKIREGVVLRPPFELRMNNGERCMSKHKRDEFREHKTPRSILDMSAEDLLVLHKAEQIADEWCVPMRLQHVLDKMRADGLEEDMKNVPEIIRRMTDDIYVEGKGEIVESKEARKAIGSKAVKLFKNHLKQKLSAGF